MPIYFIQAEGGGPIKVGYAADPIRRMSDLQCSHHTKLRLLRTIPGSISDEHRLHKKLAGFRVANEWFKDCPEVRSAIIEPRLEGVRPNADINEFGKQVWRTLVEAYGHKRNAAVLLGQDAGCPTRSAENWLSGRNTPSAECLVRIMRKCPELRYLIFSMTSSPEGNDLEVSAQ